MDGPHVGLGHLAVLDRVERAAEHVEDSTLGRIPDGHRDGGAGVGGLHAAAATVGRGHGDAAHDVVAEVLGDLEDDVDVLRSVLQLDGVEDVGQVARLEADVDHGAEDLGDGSNVAHGDWGVGSWGSRVFWVAWKGRFLEGACLAVELRIS